MTATSGSLDELTRRNNGDVPQSGYHISSLGLQMRRKSSAGVPVTSYKGAGGAMCNPSLLLDPHIFSVEFLYQNLLLTVTWLVTLRGGSVTILGTFKFCHLSFAPLVAQSR